MASRRTRSAWLALGVLLSLEAAAQDDDLDFLFGDDESEDVESTQEDRPVPSQSQPEEKADQGAGRNGQAPLETIPVPAAQAEREAPKPSRRVIEEVVVTAQKIEQNLSDVPVSVTALQGDFIKNNAVSDLTEASTYVPNVRVESTSPTSPQVFIRGFGTNTFNPSFEPSVGLVQDDVFFARGSYFTESMFDLERIEVLRGPQGTLFGKNTIAGVFNIVTRGAPATGTEANLSYKRNEDGDDRIEGGLGGRLADGLGARLAILEDHRHGRSYNTLLDRYEDESRKSAQRLRLDYVSDSNLELGLVAQRTETQVNFWPRQLYQLDDDTAAYLANFDPEIEDDPYDFQTSFNIPGYMNIDSWTVSGSAGMDLGPVLGLDGLDTTLVVAGSHMNIRQYQDLDTSPADLIRLFGDAEDYSQHSLEWRFTGLGGAPFGWGQGVTFVTGLYALQADYYINTGIEAGEDLATYALSDSGLTLISGGAIAGIPFAGGGTVAGALGPLLGPLVGTAVGEDRYTFDFRQRTRTFAAFGQLTWDLSEHWSVTPGLRLNHERKNIDSVGTSSCRTKPVTQQCLVQLIVGANDYSFSDLESTETNLSPKLSVLYRADDDLRVFATWARGYKSGGANAISFTGEDLEYGSETATSVELGIKSHWFGRSLSLNATAYRMDFDDLQVLAFNGVFFDVTNAGSAYSTGVELDSQWLTPYRPLSINTSVGWLEARYKQYGSAPAPVEQGLDARQDLSGKTLAFAPRWSATLSPTLDYSVAGLNLTFGLNARHQGDQYTDTDLDQATFVEAHTIYSARIGLGSAADTWNLSVGCKNLTDKRVLNQALDTALFPGVFLANQQPGRTIYASLNLQW